MNEFTQVKKLIGVVGKKASGKFDDGREWSTDHVELICLDDMPGTIEDGFGKTAVMIKIPNFDAYIGYAQKAIDQDIEIKAVMIPAKKLGAAPKIEYKSFKVVGGADPEKAKAATK